MKMRTPHIVPLSRQALEVLGLLRKVSGDSEWVFPGERSGERTMSNNTILKGLERMGYKGRMTGHGFRGLASTILHEKEQFSQSRCIGRSHKFLIPLLRRFRYPAKHSVWMYTVHREL